MNVYKGEHFVWYSVFSNVFKHVKQPWNSHGHGKFNVVCLITTLRGRTLNTVVVTVAVESSRLQNLLTN